jgi:hypothetical protein
MTLEQFVLRFLHRVIIKGLTLKVGVLEKNNQRNEEGITNADLAYIHENGTIHIPPRPFLEESFLDAFYQVEIKNKTIQYFFECIGQEAVKEIRKTIESSIPPPLADSTLEKRLHTPGISDRAKEWTEKEIGNRIEGNTTLTAVPLIVTEQLINSIGYEIVSH